MLKSYLSILKIVLHGRSAGKILLATILSFTFSIAVILCTFGLMDGFDHLLKSGLRHSSGDLLITNRKGFFLLDSGLNYAFSSIKPKSVAPVIQTEAFALSGESSRGVLVRGVDSESFSAATGMDIKTSSEGIVIGEVLAENFHLKKGDELALTFAKGNESGESLPMIKSFKITDIIKHGIYQKDLRFVYLDRRELAELLGMTDKVNLVVIATQDFTKPIKDLDVIRQHQREVRLQLESDFLVKPFWDEYSFLIEAVKVEKFSISLILQLIVVVAVFNIIAFVIYIMEKKAQDFFFLRAIGLSLSSLTRFWFISVVLIWGIACAGAYLLSGLFNWCLQHVSFLQIPGEIYVLSSLNIRLDSMAYVTVYAVSFIWILIAAFVGYIKLKRKPIIEGLRQEFG